MKLTKKYIEKILLEAVQKCDEEMEKEECKYIAGATDWYSKSRLFRVEIDGKEYTLWGSVIESFYSREYSCWADTATPKLEYDHFQIIADGKKIAKRVTFKGAIERIYKNLAAR